MGNRGLDVWTLKNYCVTFMDGWTPLRLFWTRDAALRCRDRHGKYAHAYRWHKNIGRWIEMPRADR